MARGDLAQGRASLHRMVMEQHKRLYRTKMKALLRR